MRGQFRRFDDGRISCGKTRYQGTCTKVEGKIPGSDDQANALWFISDFRSGAYVSKCCIYLSGPGPLLKVPESVAEFGKQINDGGRQLLELINIILDVARIESGRFDLASDRVDVARLVRSVLRQTDAAAQAAEIAIEVDVPAGLPLLRCDERRLQQALNHLVSNAIKFTGAAGSVTIRATLPALGGLLIQVTDSGIGIPTADLDRVFEPFVQLDNSLSRRYQGAGLGLYIARALVTRPRLLLPANLIHMIWAALFL